MTSDPRHPFLVIHGLMDYPFPLSDGNVAELLLPERITYDDAERLAEFVTALAQAPAEDGGNNRSEMETFESS